MKSPYQDTDADSIIVDDEVASLAELAPGRDYLSVETALDINDHRKPGQLDARLLKKATLHSGITWTGCLNIYWFFYTKRHRVFCCS